MPSKFLQVLSHEGVSNWFLSHEKWRKEHPYTLVMCFNAFDKAADLDVLNHPVLNLIYYLKAHNDWLLPLQMLVGGIAAANKNDIDQHAVDTVCALNSNSGVSSRYFLYKKVLECLMFVC
ncbi:hypothetical protein J1N35_043170 [Gossypium stocksii]|uniref:THH1/TOM1/TOM3 domain-containing protein n=1 Tax=Gossypium stocksii TaxID=47602 RepID=A0A9D3ZEV0_9ROSI|nr:hypothetical protein J1N35_043170 [Gossypium stocksii]